MGKVVVEYKNHSNGEAGFKTPDFIISGGWFEDTVTKRLVGLVSDDLHIPSTLHRLTRDDLIAKIMLVHVRPFMYVPCVDGVCSDNVSGKTEVYAAAIVDEWLLANL